MAAGAWSRMVAEKIGVTVPLKVIKHNYLVTDIIRGISKFPNVRYTDGSIYLKVKWWINNLLNLVKFDFK